MILRALNRITHPQQRISTPTDTKGLLMNITEFELTAEEQAIMDGEQGEILQKVMNTVVTYGKLMGATRLVDLQAAPHLALSWSTDGFYPFIKISSCLTGHGVKTCSNNEDDIGS